ncbi:hypothetical protein PSENEW3_00000563 [Picochlorum sp. SENEW3]|nr:hypothetical protein PSENEW3_00000563 [Picochlorum sp. SENEW3]
MGSTFWLLVASTLWIWSSLCAGTRVPTIGQSAWLEASLFFNSKGRDGILDEALGHGIALDRNHVRDVLGLTEDEVEHLVQVVEKQIGGHARRVSALRDWMHIRIPSFDGMEERAMRRARPSAFVQQSLSGAVVNNRQLERVVHGVASALQDAGLEHLVSRMMIVSDTSRRNQQEGGAALRETDRKPSYRHVVGRTLQQDDSQSTEDSPPKNEANTYVLGTGIFYQLFTESKSDAVKNLGAWCNSPVMLLQCAGADAPYLVGANNDNCFLGLDVALQPMTGIPGTPSADPITIRFDNLAEIAKTCAQIPEVCEKLKGPVPLTEDTYVLGIPLYKYTVPNALYSGSAIFTVNTTQGIGLIRDSLPISMFNYYNASALTIRELYGVDPSLQGSSETVQASLLSIGNEDSAVNVTAVNEYLGLLGLEPHSELRIRDFGVPNNVSVCEGTDNCLESMLDTQTLQSFAPNATTYFAPSSKGETAEEVAQLLMDFLDDALNAEPQTQVASLSWTWNYVNTASLPVDALEGYLKKLAAVGMTILVSSGDDGASAGEGSCYSPSDGGPLASNILSQAWPTVSPWVVSVGGTQLLALGENLETQEVVCSGSTNGGVTSGGGFSGPWLNVTTPAWQEAFVKKYLQENNATTFSGFPTADTPGYNPTGRGYPDISAYASMFPILDPTGRLTSVSGTSLSTPLAASLFTMANQKLLDEGYSLIGYANPMLYWMADNCPDAFTDITLGDNQADENGDLCLFGFPASVGWDPVTGLGSINFGPFVECAKKYQDAQKNPRSTSSAGMTWLKFSTSLAGVLATLLAI